MPDVVYYFLGGIAGLYFCYLVFKFFIVANNKKYINSDNETIRKMAMKAYRREQDWIKSEKEKRDKFEKSVEHIPSKYYDLCYREEIPAIPKIVGGEGFEDKVSLFFDGETSEQRYNREVNRVREHYNERIKNYKNIIFDFALDVNQNYRPLFTSEAEKYISTVKEDMPSSWIKYQTFIEWCQKFVSAYPNQVKVVNKTSTDTNFDKIEERLKFQENRTKAV